MVLYDKKSNFLGIGQNELSILGYEDIEEFKSYHDDFADLFVNHPGYISKFKNFSWIDYTLHSGVSNKNVILKHKNGTEIEATLDIMEIFLLEEINKSNSIYNISINVSTAKNDFITATDPHLKNENIKLEPIFEEPEENFTQKEPITQKKDEIKDDFSLVNDFEIQDYENKASEDEEFESHNEPISIKSESNVRTEENILKETKAATQKSTEPAIKLKVDMSDDINDIEKIEDVLKIKIPEKTNELEEELEVKIQNNSSMLDEKNHTDTEKISNVDEDIDFTQIIEDTGIDLEDLAMFMDEFLGESKKMSEMLHSSKDEQSIKNELLQLKGIASSLQMISFVKILDIILDSFDTEKFDYCINKFDSKIRNLEAQLS